MPVESLLNTFSGLRTQYKKLQKNPKANKQASSTIKKLANGSLKIGDKNVKKIQGLKNVYEAKSKDVRVYFQMDGNTVQIIAPCLKVDQRKSIELLKKYFT